ncbi:serine/threonine-protein kinase [Paraliomyxa miuraensis]|uniref:serine/threonine-protein kinase n=1 Tax=Paraliomyxa miuraensis TaxID=376150 RepID=UPI00225281D7|nr:serine/threonine-protein kinase [Paraliomyxa miuraensis]MCX4246095.1 serine/threonine protein kinase [Paraliomyxa miuraensis]
MALAPRLAPGSVFARDYRIVDLLAEGGMGAVYRAEQLSTRKLRALKLVTTRLAADPKGRERFVREATVGASIDSEHVVEVIGAGIDDETGRPWLAMELLDGADLGAVARHQGPLSPGQLREVVGQLCHGLASAHRAAVVHRDLKPANVFIARSRRAGVPFTLKILDFGIAKVVQESGTGATETDTVGSPLWMSPEQLNAQRPTPATDVWALGLLAFWALTGKHYWLAAHAASSNVQALFVEQLFKPIEPPSQRAAALGALDPLPNEFDAWFLRCLDREPSRRFPDAATAGQALQGLLPEDPEAAARLLPDVPLRPSDSVTDPYAPTSAEATNATEGAKWDASAVVHADTIANARSLAEGESTHADPAPLHDHGSVPPLPHATGTSARPRTSPVVVTLAVALAVSALAGGGYFAWQRLGASTIEPTPTPTAAITDEPIEPQPGASTSAAAAVSSGDEPGTEDTADPDPTAALPSVDPDDPALEPVVPLRTQLEPSAHDVRFLGWSTPGHRFALEVEHRADRKPKAPKEPLADGSPAPAPPIEPYRITLVQVHDALTGTTVASYLVSREGGEAQTKAQKKLDKAASEARPHGDWPAARDALGLVKTAPSRSGPHDARLVVQAKDAPEGTKLSLPPSDLGVAFRWSVQPQQVLSRSNVDGPEMTVRLERGDQQWPLWEIATALGTHRLANLARPQGEAPAAVGRVLAYWSPDASRMLLLLEVDAQPSDADEGLRQRRWAVRSIGPQIRLVEAGAGQRRTRELATQMAAAGLPVTVIDLRAPPSSSSTVIFDRAHEPARVLAERIRAALPGQPEPQPRRFIRDFVEVIVNLGHDAG